MVPTKTKNLIYKLYHTAAHIHRHRWQRMANTQSRHAKMATQEILDHDKHIPSHDESTTSRVQYILYKVNYMRN